MRVLIVIPARYASTRYPGKPLVTLTGATGRKKTLIQRSWEVAQEVSGISRVIVATDDPRIKQAVEGFGGEVAMTPQTCANGTERCAAALEVLSDSFDIVVNLQGDAALTPPWFIEALIDALGKDQTADMATPVLRCDGSALAGLLADRHAGRVGGTTAVFGTANQALYFSKEVIPHTGLAYADSDETPVFHHVGAYAFRPDVLRDYPSWPVGPLEQLEQLEQLRFLEQGKSVLCVEVDARGRHFWELNNIEDVAMIETNLAACGII